MNDRSILIIDDDKATCTVLALALGIEGYACAVAHDCREALAHLKSGPPPDLILLDLLLPDANGCAFLERLSANPAWRGIPVVLMSAWGKADEVARDLRLELLAKPFSLSDAERLIDRYLPTR